MAGWEIRVCLDVCYSGNAVSYIESLKEEDFEQEVRDKLRNKSVQILVWASCGDD